MAELKIFSGNAHPKLANRVGDRLRMPLGNAKVGRFSDGEVSVEIEAVSYTHPDAADE